MDKIMRMTWINKSDISLALSLLDKCLAAAVKWGAQALLIGT